MARAQGLSLMGHTVSSLQGERREKLLTFLLNHDGQVVHCSNSQKEKCNLDDANKEGSKLGRTDFRGAADAHWNGGYTVCEHCIGSGPVKEGS